MLVRLIHNWFYGIISPSLSQMEDGYGISEKLSTILFKTSSNDLVHNFYSNQHGVDSYVVC